MDLVDKLKALIAKHPLASMVLTAYLSTISDRQGWLYQLGRLLLPN